MAYDPEYHREWYQKNKERIRQKRLQEREDKAEYFRQYRASHSEENKAYQREYRKAHEVTVLTTLVKGARVWAKKKGVPCTITKADINIPEICPVFGLPMYKGEGRAHDMSPSIDEIVPGLGYVPGNFQIISLKANMMKQNATPEQLRQFAEWVLKEDTNE